MKNLWILIFALPFLAYSAYADHLSSDLCLSHPSRTIHTLPTGEIGPQDKFLNSQARQTIDGSHSHITVLPEDPNHWGLNVRRPGGKFSQWAPAFHTCVIGVRATGPCDESVTWEECNALYNNGGIHHPNYSANPSIQGGDVEFKHIFVRHFPDGILTPRTAPAVYFGVDHLRYKIDKAALVDTRDDAIEVDSCQSMTIKNVFARSFGFASARPGTNNHYTPIGQPTWTFDELTVVDLDCQLSDTTGVDCGNGTRSGWLFKWPASASSCTPEPRIVINGLLYIRVQAGSANTLKWPADVSGGGLVRIFWNGEGAYPGDIPTGVNVELYNQNDWLFDQAEASLNHYLACESDWTDCTWQKGMID